MKYVLAAFVFILALGLTYKSVASEAVLCTAEKKENCVETKAHDQHAQAGAGHKNLGEKMNSLFPEKQKNPSMSDQPTLVKIVSPKFLSQVSGSATKLEWLAHEGATN